MDTFELSKTLSREKFENLISELSDRYYNSGENVIPDNEYDKIVELYEKKYGKYGVIGSTPRGEKIRLPMYMGSLDKIKTREEILRWTKKYKGDYIITNKIDGVSALYDGSRLYTRGDGTRGSDISFMIDILGIKGNNCLIRGEIYMKRSVFLKKYSDRFSNCRNIVTGLLNPLTKNREVEDLRDLSFIAYEFRTIEEKFLPLKQFKILTEMKYETPSPLEVEELSEELLKNEYIRRREDEDYDMDGLVIYHQSIEESVDGENPKNTIAFKVKGEEVQTMVEYVEWNASKHGVLKPRIKIESVVLGGVTINWASGFNGKFIYDNKIGVGSIVTITRSGDVIPYITSVVKGSEVPDMPTESYKWNETEVDILCDDNENKDIKLRRIVEFFKTINAKFLGESTIKKLYESGFDSLSKIISLNKEELLNIEGIKEKSADRILSTIKNSIRDAPLYKIYSASGVLGMGFGEKKLEKILETYPDIIEYTDTDMVESLLKKIGGFQKTARQFSQNLQRLRDFMDEHIQINSIRKGRIEIVFESDTEESLLDTVDKKYNQLKGKSIVFTGTRDSILEKKLKDIGCLIKTSVSKKTDILVTSTRYSGSSKEISADRLGVPVFELQKFREEYEL